MSHEKQEQNGERESGMCTRNLLPIFIGQILITQTLKQSAMVPHNPTPIYAEEEHLKIGSEEGSRMAGLIQGWLPRSSI